MKPDSFRGRDYLAETDFTTEEILKILEVAQDLKRDRAQGVFHNQLLRSKTLFMVFFAIDPFELVTPSRPG